MSLYNMLCGVSGATFYILPMIGKHPEWFPRFRDCFTECDEPKYENKIIVYTRTGGGNRDDYEDENDAIRALPGFVCDFDDDFDCTYANWVFSVPAEWRTDYDLILSKQWAKVSDAYVERCKEVFPKIADKIGEQFQRPGQIQKDSDDRPNSRR